MSYQRPSESPSYDKFVSLNEYALVSIMRHLESATNFLTEGELSAAVTNLNYAWTICPEGVRKKMNESPSKIIKQRIKQEVPSIEEIFKHDEWLDTISEDRVLSHCQEEGQYFDEEGVRAKLYQESKIGDIVEAVLSELQLNVVQALEAGGLYISMTGSGKVIPTSSLVPNLQAPTKKLPEEMPR